jgi:hypothetical protein
VANERRDAVTVQELDPEDLLGGQPVVGTLDLNEMAHLEVRVPQGVVWKTRSGVTMMFDQPLANCSPLTSGKTFEESGQMLRSFE